MSPHYIMENTYEELFRNLFCGICHIPCHSDIEIRGLFYDFTDKQYGFYDSKQNIYKMCKQHSSYFRHINASYTVFIDSYYLDGTRTAT